MLARRHVSHRDPLVDARRVACRQIERLHLVNTEVYHHPALLSARVDDLKGDGDRATHGVPAVDGPGRRATFLADAGMPIALKASSQQWLTGLRVYAHRALRQGCAKREFLGDDC